jgi:hypothetical protein
VNLFGNVLRQWNGGYLRRLHVCKLQQPRARQQINLSRERITKADIDHDVLETAASERGSDTIPNCTTLRLSVQSLDPLHCELEVICEVGRLHRDHVSRSVFNVVIARKIHVLRGPGMRSESEIQRESTLQNPAIRRHNEQAAEDTFEDHLLTQAIKR